MASLIGRGQIADLVTKPTGPADRMRALRQARTQELERQDAEALASGAEDEENEE